MGVATRILALAPLRAVYRRLRPAVVRCATIGEGDLDLLAGLLTSAMPPGTDLVKIRSVAADIVRETASCGGYYTLACIGAIPVAGCQTGPLMRRFGVDGNWILGVWVTPSQRGRGAGEAVVRAAVKTALRTGIPRLYVHIAASNAASLGLFRKIGFQTAPETSVSVVRAALEATSPGAGGFQILILELSDRSVGAKENE